MNTKQNLRRPIRFSKLENGSLYEIFAEPTRGIQRSKDKTVYKKMSDSYSISVENPDKHIILYPEDLVIPLSRGGR